MTQPPMWGRLPEELRLLRQWLVAAPDKAPLSINAQGQFYNGSSTDRATWLDFDTCANAAYNAGLHIGFVFSADDPYCCVDFDVKDFTTHPDKPEVWTKPEEYSEFLRWAQHLNSYTERSRSGKGLHLIARANIGKGAKKRPVEVYSQERFMISTGDVVVDAPIKDCQSPIADLVHTMRIQVGQTLELIEVDPVMEDEAIYNMAVEADNKDKFLSLWAGNWSQMGYPSHSEADLALMSMFTFYSKSNEQCRRLFRMSALGKREKATKNNRYVNRTLVIIRNRQAREVQIDIRAMEASAQWKQRQRVVAPGSPGTSLHIPEHATQAPQPQPPSVAAALAAPLSAPVAHAKGTGTPWPPGFAGAIAGFIYESAPRPVKEVAIVGMLGLLAGICGKAWYIPGSGLNLYTILVARSAIGKEAMHSGVSALCNAAQGKGSPSIMQFVDFSDFASGPALVKACAANPSFCNIAGEWGRKLKKLAQDDGRDSGMASLRTAMTNLYQKSGPQSIVGGITYSNKDNNIASVSGVSFSMIGETTPKVFYESLTEGMMEDGFLSRFTVIEYDGERPALNPAPVKEPSNAITDALCNLAQNALRIIGNGFGTGKAAQPVHIQADAAAVLGDFEKECDYYINNTLEESTRQMWNRAALKVMRISALLAVADNCIFPMIHMPHLMWSLGVVRRDIDIMARKMKEGDVGSDDHTRERKVLSLLRDCALNGVTKGYDVPEKMVASCIVPYKVLQIKCAQMTLFKSHRQGATEALKQVLKSLADSGYIAEAQKEKMVADYNFHGKCYRILNLPD